MYWTNKTKNNVLRLHVHVPNYKPTSELKKLCDHAYKCFHDTIIICGKSVNEARTFIDLCDMYEYSCETNMVFRHVKEEEGVCPNPKELQSGAGR
ncbi:hypothetical protein ABMA28_008378 [Loxostege sticticalis]|uniref:Uncharacterized protein n=1 Tax=Loxostege sticticalis TaxID=481309 RepID=A0ABD0SGY8_LOXSC